MPRDHSERIQLQRQTLERFRDFHSAYADGLAETKREPFHHDDRGSGESFARSAAIADSRRRAAEAALVLGDEDGLRRVAAAAAAYEAAGSLFGAFLAVAAGSEVPDLLRTAEFITSGDVDRTGWGARIESFDAESRAEISIVPYNNDALASPVQQVYLAAALAASARDNSAAAVADSLAQLASRRAAVPSGPSGMPLHTYAAAAGALAEARFANGVGRGRLSAVLTAADLAHRAAVRDAARGPAWTITMRGAVPVDLDAFAFATFALRLGVRLGSAGRTFAAVVARGYVDVQADDGPQA